MLKSCRFFLMLLLLVSVLSGAAAASSYVMTYAFSGTSAIYKNYLSNTGGTVDAIAPSCFDLNEDGTVALHGLSTDFVDYLHGEGISITPFLSNHWNKTAGNAALDNIGAVTDTLRKAVYDYNLDGVNVDIQNVNETYREKYTLFVKTLREKLPGKTVTVAVAANPNGWTLGWHGSYDYAGLAANSDYLMIMAYDESYYGGAAGPVASASFVEKSIQYALKYVTADKLVLGVPFYGRYWKSGASVGGYGIVASDVETLLSAYPGAVKTYDTGYQSARVDITLTAAFTLWGGSTLSAGTYTIWYDDLSALRHKLELANKYGLLGAGTWALGQEDTGFWDICRSVLKNQIFGDINGHWAENMILSAHEKGWFLGHGGKFRPEAPLTRAEAAALFVRVCGLQTGTTGANFDDTAGHWAENDIAIARYYGLMTGVGSNKFLPNQYITRQEMAVLLDRILVLATGIDYHTSPFPDVSAEKNAWSYASVIKLYGNGIILGYPDGTFRPAGLLTRAQTAALLDKSAGYGFTLGGSGSTRAGTVTENEQSVQPR